MFSTQSVSDGCFAFKRDPIKLKKVARSRRLTTESFLDETITSKIWYKSYKHTWNTIEQEIKKIQNDDMVTVLNDLIGFVEGCNDDANNLLPTAILLTGINQTDHYEQFDILSEELKTKNKSNVVILQSRDCSTLKSAFQKLVSNFMEDNEDDSLEQKCLRRSEYTMKTLEAWYLHKRDRVRNMVVILPDFELFNLEIFKKVIMILSSYRQKLPLVLVVGVATSLSALQNSLPHRVVNNTKVQIFRTEPSGNILNKIIEKVILSPFCKFHLSGKAFQLLIDIFLFYDFSINTFVQALKHCVLDHYSQGDIFALCSFTDNIDEVIEDLEPADLSEIRRLPSCRPYLTQQTSFDVLAFFWEDEFLKKSIQEFLKMNEIHWHRFYLGLEILKILVNDLPENLFGKHIRNLYVACVSKPLTDMDEYRKMWNLLAMLSKDEFIMKLVKINESLQIYAQLLEENDFDEIEDLPLIEKNVMEFYARINRSGLDVIIPKDKDNIGGSGITTCDSNNAYKNVTSRQELKEKLFEMSKQKRPVSEFAKNLTECLEYLETEVLNKLIVPINQGPPLIELFVYGDTTSIKRHVIGTPRGALHTALQNPNYYLMCRCCELEDLTTITDSLPDTCIVYKLHLECGKMINLYDWLQSYRSIVDQSDDERHVDPEIQARFTRAVSELEFMGFIKATKRKTDHVTRLTW